MHEEAKINACARAAHEVNRAYAIATGDISHVAWDLSPDWQRESVKAGVRGVLEGNGPEESHAAWLDFKRDLGWKHGPVKDPDKREHPCFLPYAELPEAQKVKDVLFVMAVRSMAAALGMTVRYPAIGDRPPQTIDWGSNERHPSVGG
jgi:hypothetical protein